jgi:hypothetical protein
MSHFKRRSQAISEKSLEPEQPPPPEPKHLTSSALIDPIKLLEHQELITALMIDIKP